MALAQTSYPSAGVGPYSIPFPYLVKAHIEVLVNGAIQTQGVAYTFPTASSIQFAVSPAAGTIVIRRNSSRTTRLTNYQDGSKLGEQALDFDVNQAFFVAQEALDASELAIVGGAPVTAAGISVTAGNGMASFDVQAALDEHQTDINGINATLPTKANLASPALTGTPTAPTQAVGTNDTRLATTAFVQQELADDTASLAEHQQAAAVAKFPTLERMLQHPLVAKAWVNFDGDPLNGTYTLTGNVCTVNITNHRRNAGDRVTLDFTSGTAPDGTYVVATVINANSYTVAIAVANTSGNLTQGVAIRSSYNVSSVARTAAGTYTVTWATAFPNANYCVQVSSGGNGYAAPGAYLNAVSAASTSILVGSINAGAQQLGDSVVVTLIVFALP